MNSRWAVCTSPANRAFSKNTLRSTKKYLRWFVRRTNWICACSSLDNACITRNRLWSTFFKLKLSSLIAQQIRIRVYLNNCHLWFRLEAFQPIQYILKGKSWNKRVCSSPKLSQKRKVPVPSIPGRVGQVENGRRASLSTPALIKAINSGSPTKAIFIFNDGCVASPGTKTSDLIPN